MGFFLLLDMYLSLINLISKGTAEAGQSNWWSNGMWPCPWQGVWRRHFCLEAEASKMAFLRLRRFQFYFSKFIEKMWDNFSDNHKQVLHTSVHRLVKLAANADLWNWLPNLTTYCSRRGNHRVLCCCSVQDLSSRICSGISCRKFVRTFVVLLGCLFMLPLICCTHFSNWAQGVPLMSSWEWKKTKRMRKKN